MFSVKKEAKEFVSLIFLLLGVLFGALIMVFIFAQLGPENTGLTVADNGYNQSVAIQNNTLNAIEDYTEQSDTQFTTVAIAVTLLVLLALFGLFWKFFMGGDKQGRRSGGYGGGSFS